MLHERVNFAKRQKRQTIDKIERGNTIVHCW